MGKKNVREYQQQIRSLEANLKATSKRFQHERERDQRSHLQLLRYIHDVTKLDSADGLSQQLESLKLQATQDPNVPVAASSTDSLAHISGALQDSDLQLAIWMVETKLELQRE